MSTEHILGITAGALSLIAYVWYNVSIIKGETRPNKATWWILTLVGFLILMSYYQGGARESIWVPLAYVLGPLIIAILSLKYGEGHWTAFDKSCLVGALIGALLWWVFDSPLLGLLISMFIDLLGLLPTIMKSYLRPESENRTAWVMEAASSILNIFAVKIWVFSIWVYPVYLATLNLLIAILLITGHKKNRDKQPAKEMSLS